MLSILFALTLAGNPPVAATQTPATEKVVCRRESQIGSLVRKKKVCRTESEWRALAQESKDLSNGYQQRAGQMRNP